MEPPSKRPRLEAKRIEITFITGNYKKLEEVNSIIASYNLDTKYNIINRKLDLPEIQGSDYYDIVRAKCRYAACIVDGPVIIEDSGLSFSALNGLPGPYIKWFLEKIGNKGLCKMLDGFEDKRGTAHCIFAYCKGMKNGEYQDVYLFDGRVDGQIVAPRGSNGFGWDAIFQPDGEAETYGEMEQKKKNEMSPRRKAIDMLASYLGNLYI